MRPLLLLIFAVTVGSCGAPPRGDVTITMKSGDIRHGRLLAVDKNEAIARLEPWGDVNHVRLDSIASVERPGAVSPLAVMAGGALGAAFGAWQASLIYNSWSARNQVTYDPRSVDILPVPQPAYLDVLAGAAILTSTALGTWAGTFIHKTSTQLSTEDSDFAARLRTLAVFPNGLPHAPDTSKHH